MILILTRLSLIQAIDPTRADHDKKENLKTLTIDHAIVVGYSKILARISLAALRS